MTFTPTDRVKLADLLKLLGQVKDAQDAQTVILRGLEDRQAEMLARLPAEEK